MGRFIMTDHIRVAALYRFAAFSDPVALRDPLLALCKAQGVKGTLLLAGEGINGTIAGPREALETVLDHIRNLPDCADLEVKYSSAETMPFHRMKVRIKREIVTMGVDGVDARDPGRYVAPAEWNALISDPDVIVIDTRNDYEVGIGSFKGAINPETTSFGEFPGWFRDYRSRLGEGAQPKVAMFCTGGIRCEKATAFLKDEGIADVAHLKGGILAYLEQVPAEQSLWEGECFVFDDRVAVGHGVVQGSHILCRGCRAPVSPANAVAPFYVEGVSCPACAGSRDAEQRARYAERQKQVELAEARGEAHIGDAVPQKS